MGALDDLRQELALDFQTYLEFALKHEGKTPAKYQLEFADHLMGGDPVIGILACRNSSKSTCASIHYVNWRHLRCPHLKVTILTGRADFSKQIGRELHRRYCTSPWLQHLMPIGTAETIFNLTGSFREISPSIQCFTSGGNSTGSRSDLVLIDDAQQTKHTSEKRIQTIMSSINETVSLLRDPHSIPYYPKPLPLDAPERTQIVVLGTHKGLDSYSDIYTVPEDDSKHFFRGAKVRKWPALVRDDLNGAEFEGMEGRWISAIPELKDTEYFLWQRSQMSMEEWALEYMLDQNRVPAAEYALLNINKIAQHAWTEEGMKDRHGRPLIRDWHMVIDPASTGGDFFVMIECNFHMGHLYVRDVVFWKNRETEECLTDVLNIAKQRGDIRRIIYEEGFSGGMGGLLRTMQRTNDTRYVQEPVHNRENKLKRTVRLLEPTMNSGRVRLHKKIMESGEVMRQLRGLRQGSMPKPHDDIVDCLGFAVKVFERYLGGGSGGGGKVTNVIVA